VGLQAQTRKLNLKHCGKSKGFPAACGALASLTIGEMESHMCGVMNMAESQPYYMVHLKVSNNEQLGKLRNIVEHFVDVGSFEGAIAQLKILNEDKLVGLIQMLNGIKLEHVTLIEPEISDDLQTNNS
jgi:hypothetical protein